MLSDKINNFLIFSNIVVGCFAFMVLWFHIVRTVKGNALMKDKTVRGYANVNFIFSLIMLVVIWVTTVGKDFALMMTFVIFMIGWIVYEMIEKSPDIDYTKSYSVEEVQKLVDEKI